MSFIIAHCAIVSILSIIYCGFHLKGNVKFPIKYSEILKKKTNKSLRSLKRKK